MVAGARQAQALLRLGRTMAGGQLQLQTPLPSHNSPRHSDGLDHGHNWLRADPVHLQVNMDQLLLVPGSALQINAEDADALTTALNRHFAEDGLQFVAHIRSAGMSA